MGSTKTKKRGGGGGGGGRLAEVNGYKVLPVKFSADEAGATHYLYFRQHSAGREDILLPSDRTIFMANLPADTTERDLRRLFHGVARIARVVFNGTVGQDAVKTSATHARMMAELAEAMANAEAQRQKPKKGSKGAKEPQQTKSVPRTQLRASGSSAHIVLLEAAELDNVLSLKTGAIKQWPVRDPEDAGDPTEYRGVARYIYEYRAARPPAELLRTEVDAFMAKFEEAQYERERMQQQQKGVPDEDGFITVVRSRREADGADDAAAADGGKSKKPKKEVVFGNMYRFQMRERKSSQLAELRKKFEEDKERIARMRQTRQFRPY
ncbi:hypothetical protein GGF46_002481 [Coemansia sp. RSA 552]|nr:hypothetical protein GGF46_002481 [Coemansia sp. RSA 552]